MASNGNDQPPVSVPGDLGPSLAVRAPEKNVAVGLGNLPSDVLDQLAQALDDPFDPSAVVAIALSCTTTLAALQARLEAVKSIHLAAARLCAKVGVSGRSLVTAREVTWPGREVDSTDAEVLARLWRRGSLPLLERLSLFNNKLDE